MTKTCLQVHAVHCGCVRCCTVSHLLWNGVPLLQLFQQLLEASAERGSAERENVWMHVAIWSRAVQYRCIRLTNSLSRRGLDTGLSWGFSPSFHTTSTRLSGSGREANHKAHDLHQNQQAAQSSEDMQSLSHFVFTCLFRCKSSRNKPAISYQRARRRAFLHLY